MFPLVATAQSASRPTAVGGGVAMSSNESDQIGGVVSGSASGNAVGDPEIKQVEDLETFADTNLFNYNFNNNRA